MAVPLDERTSEAGSVPPSQQHLAEWYRWTRVERLWVSYYPFLLSRGYQLRPRYNPDWQPSWNLPGNKRHADDCEDSLSVWLKDSVLDAVRIEDRQKVVLKRIRTASDELQILKRLSSADARSDPRNRTIPVFDIFEHTGDPEFTFIATPYMRSFDYPPFHCRSEFVEAMRQYLEGLQFMHDNNIAHRDIAPKNMMMEESHVVPRGSHFTHEHTHTGVWKSFWWKKRCSVDGGVKYYFIDFGISEYHPDGNDDAKTLGCFRGLEEISEMSFTIPYNPFKVDLYMFGMTMLNIIKTYPGLDIFRPVGEKMCRQNPDERFTAKQALACLDEIAGGLSKSQLNATIWRTGDTLLHRLTRTLCGCYWFEPPTED